MLAAEQIVVRAGRRTLLDRVTLSIAPGELVCALGPNGAGKSTLLGALSGALPSDPGTVRLDGRAVSAWPGAALARRRAVLAQASALSFPFSVLEVVMLGRTPWAGQCSASEDLRCVAAALAETAAAGLSQRRYTTLSGGERQRVQLARALAQVGFTGDGASMNGCYLLLDEPTSAQDLAHQHACFDTARRVAARGGAVFAVVHDPNLALLYADRVLLLAGGRLVAQGLPHEVVTACRVREVFGIDTVIQPHPRRACTFMVPA